MRRRLFTILAAVSFVTCVATALLWARSYRYADYLFYTSDRLAEPTACGVLLSQGVVQLGGSVFQDYWIVGNGWTSGRAGPWDWGSGCIGTYDSWYLMTGPVPHGGIAPREPQSQFAGFGYGEENFPNFDLSSDIQPPDSVYRFVTLPHWALLLLTGVLPARWAASVYRSGRRRRLGLCRTCGYDLRASTDRCPECGTVIATKPAMGAPA